MQKLIAFHLENLSTRKVLLNFSNFPSNYNFSTHFNFKLDFAQKVLEIQSLSFDQSEPILLRRQFLAWRNYIFGG